MKKYEELGASPAPWEEDKEAALPDIICHLQNGIRYQVAVPYIHSDEETDANTRLICAAPDLYNACLWCLEQAKAIGEASIVGEVDENALAMTMAGIERRCRNALAKAAGEEE